MLDVKWEYLEDNICSDKPVAILWPTSSIHVPILYVYERGDHHYCILSSEYDFLKPTCVAYNIESKNVKQNNDVSLIKSLSAHDHLVLRLKEGCKIIKEDILKQIERISFLLS